MKGRRLYGIYPPFQLMSVTSVQSDMKPKKINEGVLKIGKQYINTAIVCKYVKEENSMK